MNDHDVAFLQVRENTASTSTVDQSGIDLLADLASNLETPDNLDDAEAAAARFDVSPFRMWLLFQSVDENHDGFITKKELAHALNSASSTNYSGRTTLTQDPATAINEKGEKTSDGSPEDTKSNDTDDNGDDDDSLVNSETMPLQDIEAFDELFDRIVHKASELESQSTKDGEDETYVHRDLRAISSSVGVSFPQFCRIMRYLWLQQLLNTELDNSHDTENEYCFECVDYSSGYYRHKKITGNISQQRTRDFFTAPRHGHARMRWVDVPSGTFATGSLRAFDSSKRNQKDSFRITILRLAVKYRFHPTSIEDAIDLEFQEPKVNSFVSLDSWMQLSLV